MRRERPQQVSVDSIYLALVCSAKIAMYYLAPTVRSRRFLDLHHHANDTLATAPCSDFPMVKDSAAVIWKKEDFALLEKNPRLVL